MSVKVNILFDFSDGPWGGANQFLKAIKRYLEKNSLYEEDPYKADVILINSSPMSISKLFNKIYEIKKRYPNKVVVNRIDGPVYYIRGRSIEIDRVFYLVSEYICNAIVFQSEWSKDKNIHLGLSDNDRSKIILNAPDKEIFYPSQRKSGNDRTKLIATSWSNNWSKGFDVYTWLDENLDFSKYEMLFIGNSPVKFKNIKCLPPMNSKELSEQLRKSDIYITGSQRDPCSNSLIEALHCGLPSIALDDGGHTEIVAKGGRVFSRREDILDCIKDVEENYSFYKSSISLPSIDDVGLSYYQFLEETFNKSKGKQCNIFKYFHIKVSIIRWAFIEKCFILKTKLLGSQV